jgi:hypothetical protein
LLMVDAGETCQESSFTNMNVCPKSTETTSEGILVPNFSDLLYYKPAYVFRSS